MGCDYGKRRKNAELLKFTHRRQINKSSRVKEKFMRLRDYRSL